MATLSQDPIAVEYRKVSSKYKSLNGSLISAAAVLEKVSTNPNS
jgi:hypothetical protein